MLFLKIFKPYSTCRKRVCTGLTDIYSITENIGQNFNCPLRNGGFLTVSSGVPDGAARLKTRSAGWNRAGWELNTLDG